MDVKVIKLTRKDDLAAVVRKIKDSQEREIIFDLEKGSPLLASADHLKLIKKTGEVLGKIIHVQTSDPAGSIIARRAGMLATPMTQIKSVKSTQGSKFSDIRVGVRKSQKPTTANLPIAPASRRPAVLPVKKSLDEGRRMEIVVPARGSWFSKLFIFVLVVLVLATFGAAVLLPRADISIYARSEPITRDFDITVDKNATAVAASTMTVPGIAISKEVSQTKAFPTTGTQISGNKASGTVTIYNFTANILTLRAATTTLTAGGKKFSLTKDLSGLKPNGSPNAGVAIVAQSPGDDSNLPASTQFQVVNSALGNRNVYGINPQALAGGTSTNSSKILSQQDLDNAANQLIVDATASSADDLTTQLGSKVVLVDSGLKKDILTKTANKNLGDAAESFDITLIVRLNGLGFRQDDINNLVTSKINEVLSADKYLPETNLPKFSSKFKSVDFTNGKGVLAVHFETTAAYKVDNSGLAKLLAGKNESEIKEILLSKPEVDNVDVKFWPSWFVHKAPRYNGKVNISTQLSTN